MATKREPEDDAVELLTWDPSDGTEEDEECDDELPADEDFVGDEEEEAPVELAEVEDDGYAKGRPAELPQPDRARSHPDLPKVKSNSFKRIIR